MCKTGKKLFHYNFFWKQSRILYFRTLSYITFEKQNLSITLVLHHNYTIANTANIESKNVKIYRLPLC